MACELEWTCLVVKWNAEGEFIFPDYFHERPLDMSSERQPTRRVAPSLLLSSHIQLARVQ